MYLAVSHSRYSFVGTVFLWRSCTVNLLRSSKSQETRKTMCFLCEDLEKVRRALEDSNDINKYHFCDQHLLYYTPLGFAIENNNLHIFKYLIRKKADINKIVSENALKLYTPLWHSVYNRRLKFIEILLKNNAKRTFSNDEYSMLTYAVERTEFSVLHCLLENGEDVNEKDARGRTPLIAAVKCRNVEMVKTLLNYGAEFTAHSALLEAIFREHKEIVELLIERGATVNYQSVTGFTPLTKATSTGSLEIVEILVNKGADVNMLDIQGSSPLINSIRTVQLDLVQLLVENGANVHQADGHGNLPLTEALHTKNFPIIKFLIENGAKWNSIRDKNGYSPLTQSVQERNFDMLKFFLDRKADVNELDDNHRSALLLAVETGNIRFVKMLTERGALVNDLIENIKQLANNNDDWNFFLEELEAEKRIVEHNKTDKTDDGQ